MRTTALKRRTPAEGLKRPLYGRQPNGVGTPLVECLSGYLARVCEARSISVVDALDLFVRPLSPGKFLRDRVQLPRYLMSVIAGDFDGMTSRTDTAIAALQTLTGEPDLAKHTCVPWRGLFSVRSFAGVGVRRKRWCTLCFDAWNRTGSEPWEPLLFRLEPVRRCPIHRVRLSERCPRCERTQPVVTQRVPLSYCHNCGRPLHVGAPLPVSPCFGPEDGGEPAWDWWISVVLGQLLCLQIDSKRRADPNGFASLIDRQLDSHGRGLYSLADALCMQPHVLRQWRLLKMRPYLRTFVKVCLRLGAHPADVMFPGQRQGHSFPWSPWSDGDAPWLRAKVRPVPSPYRQACNAQRAMEAAALDSVIAAGGYASATAGAASVGISYTRVKTHFPNRLRQLHAGAREYQAERLRRYRAALCRAIKDGVATDLATVARTLGVRPQILGRSFPGLCARLMKDCAERRKVQRAERVRQREGMIRDAVRALVAAGCRPTFRAARQYAGVVHNPEQSAILRAAWADTLVQCGVSPDTVRWARPTRQRAPTTGRKPAVEV